MLKKNFLRKTRLKLLIATLTVTLWKRYQVIKSVE